VAAGGLVRPVREGAVIWLLIGCLPRAGDCEPGFPAAAVEPRRDGDVIVEGPPGFGSHPVIADFDGDGDSEIAAFADLSFGDGADATVQILDGQCGVTRATDDAVPVAAGVRTLGTVPDVTGDGRAELLIGGVIGTSESVELFSGAPTDAGPIATIHGAGVAPVWADDLPMTLAGAEPAELLGLAAFSTVYVLAGPVAGDLDAGHPYAAFVDGTFELEPGVVDLDGDGLDDVVIASIDGRTERVFAVTAPLPTGAIRLGVDVPAAEVSGPCPWGTGVASGDFDGDGDGDVLVHGAFVVGSDLLGAAQPSAFATLGFPDPGFDALYRARGRGLGDLDGDGTTDLLATTEADGIEWSQFTVDVVFGPFAGAMHVQQARRVRVDHAFEVAAGDVDGDGVQDLVGRTGRGDGVFVVLGGPASF
jgi:hypothetical protein